MGAGPPVQSCRPAFPRHGIALSATFAVLAVWGALPSSAITGLVAAAYACATVGRRLGDAWVGARLTAAARRPVPSSASAGRDQLVDGGAPPLLPDDAPRAGTSRLAHALLALMNFAFVRMFAGKIGPLPEKLGLGRL